MYVTDVDADAVEKYMLHRTQFFGTSQLLLLLLQAAKSLLWLNTPFVFIHDKNIMYALAPGALQYSCTFSTSSHIGFWFLHFYLYRVLGWRRKAKWTSVQEVHHVQHVWLARKIFLSSVKSSACHCITCQIIFHWNVINSPLYWMCDDDDISKQWQCCIIVLEAQLRRDFVRGASPPWRIVALATNYFAL